MEPGSEFDKLLKRHILFFTRGSHCERKADVIGIRVIAFK
jgi:hypothetical protein